MKKVSIIIPVYNAERFISATIKSILNQTYSNILIILVNDGSTDGTLAILRKYEMLNENIYILDKDNGGVSSARNKGLEYSSKLKADYFTFLDADDIIDSQYTELLLAEAELYNADIVSSLVREIKNEEGIPAPVVNKEWTMLNRDEALKELLYDGVIKNHSCAKLYRTSTCGKYRFKKNIAVGEDMEYLARVIAGSKKIRVSVNQLYFYIQHPLSAMNKNFSLKRADSFIAAKMIRRQFKNEVKLRNATEVKVFTEALSVLSKVYLFKHEYNELYKECYDEVFGLAIFVFRDSSARKGQRLYALLAFANPLLAVLAVKTKSVLDYK